jgi:transposase
METKVFVGVDVSKDSLDVAIGPQKDIITFANEQKGVDALVKKLSRIDPQLTVFESTGGYELLAVSSLAEAGLAVVIVNPRQVRNFAKATGILAGKARGASAQRSCDIRIDRPCDPSPSDHRDDRCGKQSTQTCEQK